MSESKKICLWSGPRNISTALMYSFAQRSDTKVFDEPLYGFYLANTQAKDYHPGAQEVLESQNQNGEEVIKEMLEFNDAPIGFYKHMTHHLLHLNRDFLCETENVILTREPTAMIQSFAQVIPNPKLEDLGYSQHVGLINDLELRGLQPIVIDSKSILENPKNMLNKLCDRLGIDFEGSMLKWEHAPRPEDGIWAKYWYKNVHQSTGFQPYSSRAIELPGNLQNLLGECRPLYRKLLEFQI